MKRSGDRRLFWEWITVGYVAKAIALLVVVSMTVVSCGREASMSRAIGDLNYDSLPAKASRPRPPVDTLHAAATDLGQLLRRQQAHDLSSRQAAKASAARARISRELQAVHRQFRADHKKLGDLGATAALARLRAVETKTAGLERALRTALARVPATGEQSPATAAAATALDALSPARKDQPLSSDLGFGTANAKPTSPALSAGVTPAYSAPSATEVTSDLPRAAEAADLSETPETKVTPAVRALADQLQGDPVRIYSWVRNEIRFDPYWGIRKGADQTLAERSGSDADQSALLIALLRASGIHARFVQGVVQLPAATAANWLDVDPSAGDRPEAAADILASSGIPTAQIRANGQLTKVRFSHFWAEAYVPQDAYRGNDEGLGGKAWLPLDPSIKANDITQPSSELTDALAPVSDQLGDDFRASVSEVGGNALMGPDGTSLQATMSKASDGLKRVIADQHGDLAGLVGGTAIRREALPYLPSSLPAQPVSVSAELRAVPDSLRSRITLAVSGSDPMSLPDPDPDVATGLSFTAFTSDLADKRITLAYVPATAQDADIVDAYHGLLNAPSYAAALIPVLRVDGRVVARGRTAVSTGYTQSFTITYRSPGYAADTVTNPVSVGSLSAIALDLGTISREQLRARASAFKQAASAFTPQNMLTDARAGELLSQLGALYFFRNDTYNGFLGRATHVHQSRDLSGAITATSITPRFLGSFPISVKYDGLTIDVDQDSQVVVAKSAADPSIDTYMRASGLHASESESAIFEYALGWQAASTARVLQAAAAQRIPIHQLNAANVDADLPGLQLPSDVKRQIGDAVRRPGTTVVTPEREVTIGGWSGVGYMVSAGASTDYRISGGISGGAAPNPFPFDPRGPFGPLIDGSARSNEKIEESTNDCNAARIYVLGVIIALLVIAAIAALLVGLNPLIVGSVTIFIVEVEAWGVPTDAPFLTLSALIWATAGLIAAAAFDPNDEC